MSPQVEADVKHYHVNECNQKSPGQKTFATFADIDQ
tara:strand:- start:224 stop:331 length:108 start_codon:yes stop_codon:yes gene_type:complete